MKISKNSLDKIFYYKYNEFTDNYFPFYSSKQNDNNIFEPDDSFGQTYNPPSAMKYMSPYLKKDVYKKIVAISSTFFINFGNKLNSNKSISIHQISQNNININNNLTNDKNKDKSINKTINRTTTLNRRERFRELSQSSLRKILKIAKKKIRLIEADFLEKMSKMHGVLVVAEKQND